MAPATPIKPGKCRSAGYSLSHFRQITTSLGRLLAFIRLLLDLPARAALLHALLRSVGETVSAMEG